MNRNEDTATSAELLAKASNWMDGDAWLRLTERYDPFIRAYCRSSRLSEDDTEEVVQKVWIHLAQKLVSFQYDPRRRFRGWLAVLIRSRIIDTLRIRRKDVEPLLFDPVSPEPFDDDSQEPPVGLETVELVQEVVRSKVKAETWQAFWLVSIEGCSLRETADRLGKTRTAVFEAKQRVERKLREEGERVLQAAGKS